jgi:hypothetical protein
MFRRLRVPTGACVALACLATFAPLGAVQNKALVLSGTVTNGINSVEAQKAISLGMTVDVVADSTWASMTTAQFANYRVIILGDPSCRSLNTSTTTVANNAAVWGAAVNGNVTINGTDPVLHGRYTLAQNSVAFAAAQPDKTGLYMSLSCYYASNVNTPTVVQMLNGISNNGFKVQTASASCFNNAHIVATHPALAGLTDALLSNWGCSVHEMFMNWPSDFNVLAIAKGAGSYVASDGTVGQPYVLARGEGLVVVSANISISPASATLASPGSQVITAAVTSTTNGTTSPLVGTPVTFQVLSGPDTGQTATAITDGAGTAPFTLSNSGVAGTDYVTASFVDSNGQTQTSNGASITWTAVVKTTPTITWANPADITYGTALSSTQLNAVASVPGTLTYSPAAGTVLSAGSDQHLLVNFVPTDTAHYNNASATVHINVLRATPTVSVNAPTVTYDGNPHSATASATGVFGESLGGVSIAYNGSSTAPSAAGSYAVLASYAGSSNYNAATGNTTMLIRQAPASVAADNQSRPYGAANPTLTGVVNGFLPADGIGVTYSTAATSASPVGAYSITPALSDPNGKLSNYSVTVSNGTLTVFAATLTGVPASVSRLYGSADPAFSATYSGFANGDSAAIVSGTLTCATTATVSSPVGQYPFTGCSGQVAPNYTIAYALAGVTLTVKPAPLTVTANNATRTYGAPDPSFSASYSGFLLADTAATALTAPVTFTTNETATSAVGTYDIVPGGAAATNYAIAFVKGALTVTPATLTGVPASVSRLYGSPDPAFSATYSGFVNGETAAIVSGTLTCATTATVSSPVGQYPFTGCSGQGAPNYTIAYALAGVTITVKPAPLTITADNATRYFGDANPPFTASYSGFKLTDTPATALSSPVTFSTSATASSVIGNYAIVPGGATATNYTIAFVNGTLSIAQRPTVTALSAGPAVQYSDPATLKATISPASSGNRFPATAVTFSINGVAVGSGPVALTPDVSGNLSASLTLNVPYAPGSYTVTAAFSGIDGDFIVVNPAAATLTVKAEDARATYSGALFAATSSSNSSTASVTLSATIRDISVVTGDPATDAYPGDIRNSTASFVLWNGPTSTPIAGCQNLPVGLVTSGDLLTGTATCLWSADIGSADSTQYTIGIVVGKYYTRNSSADNTVVTVSKPLDNSITGGGYLILSASSGLDAGDAGSRNNFGFNVKYNKAGTNLQGNLNAIVRRTESDGVVHVYQIKGNSMASLATSPATSTTPATAVFNGKASIQDITNPAASVGLGGNATLQVTMTDRGEPGSSDSIAITVWNSAGGMWFSSNWNGVKTVEQTIAGGNLQVH